MVKLKLPEFRYQLVNYVSLKASGVLIAIENRIWVHTSIISERNHYEGNVPNQF